MKIMKTQRAVLPLALLSAAFMLGCQDQGLEPVGLDGVAPQFHESAKHPDGHGGGGGGGHAAATLDLADGMETMALDVTVKDRTNKLNVGNTDFVQDIQMNLFVNRGTCEGFAATKSGTVPDGDEIVALEDELKLLVTDGFFTMQIDKNSLDSSSDGHLLLVERDGTFEGPTGNTRIMLGSPFDQVDPVTVKWVSSSAGVDVFEFTGPVVVWAHGVGGGGGEKSNRIIQCPGTGDDPNKVTATLTR